METTLVIAPEVQNALNECNPVVALESTLITHGLPYPANRNTALEMETAVRSVGSVPATIAILDGVITVGLSAEEIDTLAQAKNVRKCSRRDLPLAMGLGETGATTVAGTMVVAHMADIQVFATGGIGGVHRGHPHDVSADLIELGRTAVSVVCSGAKSILDLPLTLEMLETQGVPVIGYGTDTLPAFYTRSSGLPVDARIDTPEQAAAVIRAAREINAQHGILFTVPVPQPAALTEQEAETVIQEAIEAADAQGITGKAVTPFILNHINTVTDGRAMQANIALLKNNAETAAIIAQALSVTLRSE